jgi:hypothetical protein
MVTRLARGAGLSAPPEAAAGAIDLPTSSATAYPAPALERLRPNAPHARQPDRARDRRRAATRRSSRYYSIAARGRKSSKVEIAGMDGAAVEDLQGKPVSAASAAAVDAGQSVRSNGARRFRKVKQMHKEHPGLLNTRASWDKMNDRRRPWVSCHGRMAGGTGMPGLLLYAVLLGRGDLVKRPRSRPRGAERGAHDIAISPTAYASEQTGIAEQC